MIEKLLGLGLSEREVKVYLTLLRKNSYTAAELQELVNIPRTKIYEVLTKMIHRGICIEKRIGRNKYYVAVEPKLVFNQIYEQEKTELEHKKEMISSLIKVFNPIYNEGRSAVESDDFIEILKDKNLIHHKYTSLLRNSRKELLTFNKGPYSCDNPDKVREQNYLEISFLNQGGKSRGLYEVNELENLDWLIEGSRELIRAGHDARMLPELPIKMIVFDESAVMFALNEKNSGSNLTMITIEHCAIASACRILFEHLWSLSEDFKKMSAMKKELITI